MIGLDSRNPLKTLMEMPCARLFGGLRLDICITPMKVKGVPMTRRTDMEKTNESDKDGESGADVPAGWIPNRNLLSNSVSKKGDGILAWAMMMPSNRCPFASEVCKRLCYTFVGNFPLQDERHRENFEFSKSPQFVETMTEEICRFAEVNRGRDVSVAIHERGEFYNLEYLHKWAKIISSTRRIGNLSYFIYTRSWRNPAFREALEKMASENSHLRVNLSLDSDMVAKYGVPKRIGDGNVIFLAEDDRNLPPPAADLVLRNLRIRHDRPMERIGGVLVCPNESGLYVAKRRGEALLQKGACRRIECQSCRLCIDRSESFWEAMKHRYAGTPGEEPQGVERNPDPGDGQAATNGRSNP